MNKFFMRHTGLIMLRGRLLPCAVGACRVGAKYMDLVTDTIEL